MCYQLPFLVSLLAINLNSYSLPVIGTNISRSVSSLSSGSVWAFLVKIADCIWKQCQWLTKPPKELAAGSAIRNYQEATHFRSRNLIHSSFEFWTLSCTDNSPICIFFLLVWIQVPTAKHTVIFQAPKIYLAKKRNELTQSQLRFEWLKWNMSNYEHPA